MTTYYGSQYNLNDCVKHHLFLLCPNNSGSTFLINAIKTSNAVWGLPREGQHVLGFSGPATGKTEFPLLWGSKPEWIERFQNPTAYDWSKSKKAWYFQASAQQPDAPVFATKSPPFLLIADQLAENFSDTRFIFMVRNPYPVIESITRKYRALDLPLEDCATMAARHVIACFRQQIENKARYENQSVFFRYEDMCADPVGIAKIIRSLVPELADLNLDQKLAVKGMYNQRLTNMNDEQIKKLPQICLDAANRVFEENTDILEVFGYSLMNRFQETIGDETV